MTEYEKLLDEAVACGLIVKEKPLKANNGRILGNRVAIKKDLTETEKKCTMAEELGHFYTTAGNILDQTAVVNRKQELQARDWAVEKLLTLDDLIRAVKCGNQTPYEVTEYLGITEDFFMEVLDYFKRKYGVSVCYDGYTIIFNDLGYMVDLE